MSIKINVSDLCHDAADNRLALTDKEYWANGGSKEKFSCCAVDEALNKFLGNKGYNIHENYDKYEVLVQDIHDGLYEMGCNTGSIGLFEDPEGGVNYCLEQSQYNRYFWLKWVALMAQEQGIVYEIK